MNDRARRNRSPAGGYQARMGRIVAGISALLVLAGPTLANTAPVLGATQTRTPHSRLLVSGLRGSLGSAIGPDGALYVPEGIAGRVVRVDPRTGSTTVFARGLPKRVLPGLGGATDIAFLHQTAYVLVTLVGPDVGGSDVVGIYRVDGPHSVSVVADIGAYAISHPPPTDFFIPSGMQYAMQPYRGDFLVTDGHHNRLYRVTTTGHISVAETFGDIVPTGLESRGRAVYMAEAGPVPHVAATGKVVRLRVHQHTAEDVAAGAPLNVDVEYGPGHRLFALSQGDFPDGNDPGSPAAPNTGALERVNHNGTMTPVARHLDQPTAVEFIGHVAYIVTLGGQIWTIHVSPARHCQH